MTWVRRKIIVELPTQGPVTDRDLRWEVESALQRGGLELQLRHRHPGVRTGKLQVKSAARVNAALERKVS